MTRAQAAANARGDHQRHRRRAHRQHAVNVVDGITFNLNKVTTSPVTVNVARNTDAIKTELERLRRRLQPAEQVPLATRPSTTRPRKQAALLQGDGTTIGIQNQLRALLSQPSGASSAFTTLSSIGVQLQKDGSLKINDAKLDDGDRQPARAHQGARRTSTPPTPANNGFAKKLRRVGRRPARRERHVPGKTRRSRRGSHSNQKDQERYQRPPGAIEERLRTQYSALDTTMSNANALSKYVTQQITTWNKSTA